MNKKVVIIGLIVILALSLGGLFWLREKNDFKKQEWVENKKEETGLKKEGDVEVDTGNWKVYRDEKYGFEIKYNPEWELKDVGQVGFMGGETLNVISNREEKNSLVIGVTRFTSNKKPKDWYGEQKFGGITFEKEYLINNYPTYYIEEDNPNVHFYHKYIISNGKKIISFSFQEKIRIIDQKTGEIMETSFSQYLPEFKAMVGSIRFID